MTILSKFSTFCAICSLPIAVGASIEWQRGRRASHTACYWPQVAAASAPVVAVAAPVASERPIELDPTASEVNSLRRRSRDALTSARSALSFGDLTSARSAINSAADACDAIKPTDEILGDEIAEVVAVYCDMVNAANRATEAAGYAATMAAQATEPTIAEVIAEEREEERAAIVADQTAEDLSLAAGLERARARAARIASLTASTLASGVIPTAVPTASVVAPAPILTVEQVTEAIGAATSGTVMIGIGDAVYIHWAGRYERTASQRRSILASAGLPASWAADASSARSQAGEAMRVADVGGRRIVAETTAHRRRAGITARPTYTARWTVIAPTASGAVGDSAGQKVAVLTLVSTELRAEGDPEITGPILREFERLCAADVYQAGKVTSWIQGILRGRWHAVNVVGNWYVPSEHAADARRLVEAFEESGWGQWAVDQATTGADLYRNLSRGLVAEVVAVENDLQVSRKMATDRGDDDVSATVAARLLEDLVSVQEHAGHYSALLGPKNVAPVLAEIARLRAVLQPLTDAVSERGRNLDMRRS